ncbi:MAG: triosephosphate isomerase, partial [bacterium]|nr:triosephosphate isomerase [bacterium]
IYGGSVESQNSNHILSQNDTNRVLIDPDILHLESFFDIIVTSVELT